MIFKAEKVVVRNTKNSNLLTGTIFQEIKKAGQLRSCFPYNKNMHNLASFTKNMENNCNLYAVYYRNLLCGAVWINNWEFRTARLTFSAFKTTARLHFYGIMKETTRHLMHLKDENNNYYHDSLYGLIEEKNKKIIRAALLSGLKKTGFIPNFYGENSNVVILSAVR
jgi:hypothetical protein